ncbi:hypothetical protein [Leptolyngbya sp. NIES-2104]|uniref:hypothetical protein n=1 Tax=Leptolyngbya sp. NIES-2104 TaxID=1552121 RepID=UPI0006EC57EC|nr:hypothetical protein [Leptolyngbya sp. NIES-2104]GAP99801.1 glutathione S-transferase-like [Leptolyngbya sp. NIES-2104]
MSVQNTSLSWDQILELAQNNTPARRVRRPEQLPSTAPIPSSLHKLSPETPTPVLLYRDANSWCPFCQQSDQMLLPWGQVGGRDKLDPFSSAVGAVTLAYVRNRICAPRDMSAGAATAFRAAADKVLASIY